MEPWQSVLLAIGGNAVLLAVLGVLGKSLLEKLLARDSARFESELQAKADAAIEHLKTELQLKTIEHQVRFSRLHERRAAVIAELNGHLVEALWEAESFLSPFERAGEPDKKEKHNTSMNKLAELYRYFDKHRIYLPVELCASLEQLIREVRRLVIEFGVYTHLHDHSLSTQTYEQKEKAWNNGWEAIKKQVPLAREQLEDEFRKLLGATANPTSQGTLRDRTWQRP